MKFVEKFCEICISGWSIDGGNEKRVFCKVGVNANVFKTIVSGCIENFCVAGFVNQHTNSADSALADSQNMEELKSIRDNAVNQSIR